MGGAQAARAWRHDADDRGVDAVRVRGRRARRQSVRRRWRRVPLLPGRPERRAGRPAGPFLGGRKAPGLPHRNRWPQGTKNRRLGDYEGQEDRFDLLISYSPVFEPMENPAIARIFAEIADLLEIKNENAFKIRAYRNASETISRATDTLASCSDDQLRAIPGIGKDLAAKIREIAQT